MKKYISLFLILGIIILTAGCIEGEKGRTGAKGEKGANGNVVYVNCGETFCIMNQTPNQTVGYTPIFGVDYFNGLDGYTPIFGVDYFNGSAGTTDYNLLSNLPNLSQYWTGTNYNTSYDVKPTLQNIYPVGSIYLSTSSTNPNTLFGFGTWNAISTGRMLIGIDIGDTKFDTVREVGGEETSTEILQHTHAISIIDAGHNHQQKINDATTGGLVGYTSAEDTSTNTPLATGYYTAVNLTGITAVSNNPSGSVSSISLMNPYYTVYIWERAA